MSKKLILSATSLLTALSFGYAQSAVQNYVTDAGAEKIKKQIVIEGQPITAGGYDDGHGRNPRLASANQIPDTIALITFYIYDKGNEVKGGYYLYSYSLSEKGGNYVANGIHQKSIAKLKESYQKLGAVLLTPDEFLNTQEKKDFYYKQFQPQISKLGNFLSGLETKGTDVSVCADMYRGFDLSAAADHARMESLGSELAKKLGVDGVLSVACELASDKKEVNMTGIKMALHGANPIPKKDKKYISQNMGAGYYHGQLFASGYFYFKSPLQIAEYKKNQIVNEQYDGIGDVLGCFAEKFDEVMKKAIEKNSK